MRFPLVRSGGDETPIAWWEWLFLPIMMPLFFIFLLVLAVVSVPVEFVYRRQMQREEKRVRPRLAAAGRLLEWTLVEAKLRAGEGTLIVEHLSPKGPIREWWVEDDLIAAAPVPLPTSLKSLPSEGQLQVLMEYAAACAARYTNVEAGAAKLTEVPVPLARRLDPAKYVIVDLGGMMTAILLGTGRKVADMYPAGRVVTLVAWLGEPVLFAGDAESVFLAGAEPVVTPVADVPHAVSDPIGPIDTRLKLRWYWGLIGGTILALVTAGEVIAVRRTEPGPWREMVVLPLALFGIGFMCGSVAGWLRDRSDRPWWIDGGAIGGQPAPCTLPLVASAWTPTVGRPSCGCSGVSSARRPVFCSVWSGARQSRWSAPACRTHAAPDPARW